MLDNYFTTTLDSPHSFSNNKMASDIHSTLKYTSLTQKYGLQNPPKSPVGITLPSSDKKSTVYRSNDKAPKLGTASKEMSSIEIIEKMFEDFDGTHLDQKKSDQNVAHKSDTKNFQGISTMNKLSPGGSQLDPKMIYYPAPVPSMLNLPKKLSKRPSSMTFSHMKSKSIGTTTSNLNPTTWQSSTANKDVSDSIESDKYLSPTQVTGATNIGKQRPSQDLTNLPPHVRASIFFEEQNHTQDVLKLKDDSAVATLDSILDASAHTPVSVFTDHTFARNSIQLSRSEQKRKNSCSYLKRQKDNSNEEVEGLGDQEEISNNIEFDPFSNNASSISDNQLDLRLSIEPLKDLKSDEKLCDSELCDEIYENEVFCSPPTTLLAELQMRKQRQKQRTQPLTKTFPNGIHSTLLELDTAIQTEQKTRRKGRTILAWEDPAIAEAQAAMQDDEDVPLGILYPKNITKSRPLGLLEQRTLGDQKPLNQKLNRSQDRLVSSQGMNLNNNFSENNNLGTNNIQVQRGLQRSYKLPLIDSARSKSSECVPPALTSLNPVALPYFEKTAGSLLAIHERQSALRSASIQNLKNFSGSYKSQQKPSLNVTGDLQNQGHCQYFHVPQTPSQKINFKSSAPISPNYITQPFSDNIAFGQSWGTNPNGLVMNQDHLNPNKYMTNMNIMPINMTTLQPAEQGQMDRVERWRQSVMPLIKPSV